MRVYIHTSQRCMELSKGEFHHAARTDLSAAENSKLDLDRPRRLLKLFVSVVSNHVSLLSFKLKKLKCFRLLFQTQTVYVHYNTIIRKVLVLVYKRFSLHMLNAISIYIFISKHI